MRILVVEDDPALQAALGRALRGAGYEPQLVAGGSEALARLRDPKLDAVILDLGLPDMDGLDVCRRMRADGRRIAILVLTARAAIAERVAGLDAGADDYLAKPFALDELLARLRALLRRAGTTDAEQAEPLGFADLRLDPRTMESFRGDRRIELTRTEYLLLELFMRNPGTVLQRGTILERVWGYDFGPESNSLDVYVGYLRRKLEASGEPRVIQTIRGVGYALREAA